MTVYIVIHNENDTGEGSVKGIFLDEVTAKLFIADYVLENEVDTSYLTLFKKEVSE